MTVIFFFAAIEIAGDELAQNLADDGMPVFRALGSTLWMS